MAQLLQVLCAVGFLCLLNVSGVKSHVNVQELIDNEAEGKRLAQDIDDLLVNDSIPENYKVMIRDQLKHELILQGKVYQPIRSKRSGSLPSGVVCPEDCCKVVVPTESKKQTSTVAYSCTHYYSQRYKTKCGLFGWSRCTRHRTKSTKTTCYRVNTWYKSVTKPCPGGQESCCEGYFWYQECCIHSARFQEIIEEIRRRG